MPEILLATLNARHAHAAFGLRYLQANLGDLRARSQIAEFDINQRVLEIAEKILAAAPRILGLGVYIWNAAPSLELVALLKRLRPDIIIVLGGPEVSYEWEEQPITRLADYLITGEADLAFAALCRRILAGEAGLPRVTLAPAPDLAQLTLPYDLYNEVDQAHRVIYVEASRGCPFTCEFCLSSLDVPVRQVPLDGFLAALDGLHRQGVRRFKFVDRTFNLNLAVSRRILEFFWDRCEPGLFAHFEMIPDRLPEALREVIARFPPGVLQFEVGVQTLNPEVEARIQRRQNQAKLFDNLRWLRTSTGVHLHLDLIAGLPGEDLESFGAGFDRLAELQPQEIQIGILKRLRGAPVARHTTAHGLVFNPAPPYEVLETAAMDFPTLARIRRLAAFWDLFGNSGRFAGALPMVWGLGSPFAGLLTFSDWLTARGVGTSGIALRRQFDLLATWLAAAPDTGRPGWREALASDYQRAEQRDRPPWLPAGVLYSPPRPRERRVEALPRQARRLPAAGLPRETCSTTLSPE